MIWYLCISLRTIGLVWPTRLVFLAMGEVLSFGSNLVVSSPSDIVGVARHVLYCCHRGYKDGVYIILLEFIPLYHVILPKALLRSYELNTLDACWIVVNV